MQGNPLKPFGKGVLNACAWRNGGRRASAGVRAAGRDNLNIIALQFFQVFLQNGHPQAAFQGSFGDPLFPAAHAVAQVSASPVGATRRVGSNRAVRCTDNPQEFTFWPLEAAGDATTFRYVTLFGNTGYLSSDSNCRICIFCGGSRRDATTGVEDRGRGPRGRSHRGGCCCRLGADVRCRP